MKSISAFVLAAAVLLSAAPAQAEGTPTLPAGDELFEITCTNDANDRQLFSLDLVALTRDPIGSGSSANDRPDDCGSQGAILPGTDWFYFMDFQDEVLVRADLNTGEIEDIAPILLGGAVASVKSLAIGPDGSAYMLSPTYLYSLNLGTGALTDIGAINFSGSPFGFAYDAVTDGFYVVSDGDATLHTLDIDNQSLTMVGTNTDNFWVGSMSFDSDGNLWMNGNDYGVAQTTLADFGTAANWKLSGQIQPEWYSESLVVRHGSVDDDDNDSEGLANTGSADAAPYLLGGLLAAGIALALRRQRV